MKNKTVSKAEDRALERYPILKTQLGDINCLPRIGYLEGYHQAEKDLELTWEDIEAIDQLLWDLCGEYSGKKDNEGYYQEVLKRFKDFKERKGEP